MEAFEVRELGKIADLEAEHKLPEPDKEPVSLFSDPEEKPATIHRPVDQVSLHEKISSHIRRDDLNEKVRGAKVESLKSAISLNRKIAFVNELFGENTVEYAKAIDRLNNSEGLNDAMRYFNELKHARSWNNDDELVRELEALVQKRFS
jgi:hypothetical protein